MERTASRFRTMAALERYRGHFYNWYDTRTLQPLLPSYVSTVDSGNLAAHLLVLRTALLALPDEPILSPRLFEGLADTLGVLREVRDDLPTAPLESLQNELELAISASRPTLAETRQRLDRFVELAGELAARDSGDGVPTAASGNEYVHDWATSLLLQCRSARDELALLVPWTPLLSDPDDSGGPLPAAHVPTLRELAGLDAGSVHAASQPSAGTHDAPAPSALLALRDSVTAASELAQQRIEAIDRLVAQASDFATVDFDFLYDSSRRLLAIGYNVTERRRDMSFYDLMASEARLCSFLAIAQGALPLENWFALGRLLTLAGGDPVLLSWSGSMFEYLMPQLVMPSYPNTLLDHTNRAAVRRQIEYGEQKGVPWGMSESGYYMFDAHQNYQYRAFGVPGLGLQRGLADDLVIAPYAVGTRVDGRAGSRVRKPAAAGGGRPAGPTRHAGGSRLHAKPLAAWPGEIDRSFVHGAPSGNEPGVHRGPPARSFHPATLRGGAAVPGYADPAARKESRARRSRMRTPPPCRCSRLSGNRAPCRYA